MNTQFDLQAAHKHSSAHREEIAKSSVCGCFFCKSTFAPTAIEEWTDAGQCAFCPECQVDSVIGDASGLPVTDLAFLEAMHEFWFTRTAGRADIVNVAELPLEWLRKGARFEVGLGHIDQTLGTSQIGATLHVVPPGKTAWPFHRHHGNDELFFVLSGTGTLRLGKRRLPIKAGDCIGAPAGGEAHQIINSSDAELRYIAFANHGRADVIEYPDTGRIAVDIAHGNDRDPPSIFSTSGRLSPVGYWEAEDLGTEKTDE